ncbi:MAG: hypothetical protein IPK73_20855 [Candidatus Obscuribacter sp.]|nr:hypothetical protein [Candidatus Obscuribacter sp.]MBK9276568.1 hypothetical protein [Candidatus Obscuribacter sp.]
MSFSTETESEGAPPGADGLASQFLREFHQRLLAAPRKRLELQSLVDIFLSIRPEVIDSAERLGELLTALKMLESSGAIVLPKGKRGYSNSSSGKFRLPLWVTVSPSSSSENRLSAQSIPWVPVLNFCSTFTSQRQILLASVVNQFLIENRGRQIIQVPLRERSLQLFGDEKQLDKMCRDGAIFDGKLPISAIGAREVEYPLVVTTFEPGHPVLIVENHHTYFSFCEWNRISRMFSAIVYGAGMFLKKAERSIDNVMQEFGADQIFYFGDIDLNGFEIPISINRVRKGEGRTSLLAADSYYGYALQFGVQAEDKSWTGNRTGKLQEICDEVSAFLPALSASALAVMFAGRRIAQECLGLEALTSGQCSKPTDTSI